jgi:hypothetical protein
LEINLVTNPPLSLYIYKFLHSTDAVIWTGAKVEREILIGFLIGVKTVKKVFFLLKNIITRFIQVVYSD